MHVSVEFGGGGFWGYVGWWLSHLHTPSRLPDHTRGQMLRTGRFYMTAPERRQESAPQGFGVTGCHGLGSEGGHSMHVSSTNQVNHDWEGFAVTSTSGETYSSKINRLIGRSHFLRIFSHAACFCFQISSAHICIEDGCVSVYVCVCLPCVCVCVCTYVY